MNLRNWITAQAIGAKAVGITGDDALAAYWRNMEAAREPFYASAAKRVRSVFRSEMKRVVSSVERSESTDAALDSDEWTIALRSINMRCAAHFGERATAAMNAGKSLHVPQRKELADVWYEFIEQYIRKTVAQKVALILGTTRNLIKTEIRKSIEAGEGVFEASQRIEKLYLEQIIPHRSEVIARTEIVSSSNAATQASARATGLKMRKRWLATPDDRTRDWHADAHGQERELDEPVRRQR